MIPLNLVALMLLIVEGRKRIELPLHLWAQVRKQILKQKKVGEHTGSGIITSCTLREENGQKLCCRTIAVSFCSAAHSGPRRL
jgi:hypothetical protein